jgi:S1-C subfamily serine protease
VGIVTALHGIAGCGRITAMSKQGPILSQSLSAVEVDIENDLVLLTSDELNAKGGEGIDLAINPTFKPQQHVRVTGHPYGNSSLTTELILRDPPLRTLRDLLTQDALSSLLERKSPAPDITVLSIQGAIVPGNSGAPILNSSGEVIGVASGGLFGGSTDITWAIPLERVRWREIDRTLSAEVNHLGSMNPTALFSFDETVTLTTPGENTYLIRAENCSYRPDNRLQTGFTVRGTKGIVTALHGVAGCQTILAVSAEEIVLHLKITKMDFDRDVALLSSAELDSLKASGFDLEGSVAWTSLGTVRVFGYPYGIDVLETTLSLRNPPVTVLRKIIPINSMMAFERRGSPDPHIKVLSLQGGLLPGHAGAPLLDSYGRVVAVADGSLEGGSSGISWAIPFQEIVWVPADPSGRLKTLGQSDYLF